MKHSFSALRYRDFRLYFCTQSLSLIATCIQQIAQNWLVLRLSHNSGTAFGLTVAARYVPVLFLAPYAGVWVDRLPVRATFAVEQVLAALLAVVLTVLSVTGALQVWHVVVVAGLLGCCTVGNFALQQALFAEIVPERARSSAVALRSSGFHVARVIGLALAGPVVAAGGTAITVTFAADAVTFIAVAIAVAAMRPTARPRQARSTRQVRAGLAHVRTEPTSRTLMLLGLVMGIVGMPFATTLIPILAARTGSGATGFGYIADAVAFGAVLGQLQAAGHSNGLRGIGHRILVLGTSMFSAAAILAAVAPERWWAVLVAAVILSAVGYSWTGQAQVLLLDATPPALLGRVNALYFALGEGSIGLGAPLVGWLATTTGPHLTLAICGVLTAATGALTLQRTARPPAPAPPVRLRPVTSSAPDPTSAAYTAGQDPPENTRAGGAYPGKPPPPGLTHRTTEAL